MKPWLIIQCALIFVNCGSVDEEKIATDVKTIRQRLTDFTAMINKEEFDATQHFFTEEAQIITPGNESVVGTAAIRGWLENVFGKYQVRIENISKAVVVFDDKAYDRGVYIWELRVQDDQTDTITGWYLHHWTREPGDSWKITKQSWTAPPVDGSGKSKQPLDRSDENNESSITPQLVIAGN